MGLGISVGSTVSSEPYDKHVWYTGDNGLIPKSCVVEALESPHIAQPYDGGSLLAGNPWTLALFTEADIPDFSNHFILSIGGFAVGYGNSNQNGWRAPDEVWQNIGLFTSDPKLYFMISNGEVVQAYRGLDKIGLPVATSNIVGNGSWRSRAGSSLWEWANEIRVVLYNKALSYAEQQVLLISMSRAELILDIEGD